MGGVEKSSGGVLELAGELECDGGEGLVVLRTQGTVLIRAKGREERRMVENINSKGTSGIVGGSTEEKGDIIMVSGGEATDLRDGLHGEGNVLENKEGVLWLSIYLRGGTGMRGLKRVVKDGISWLERKWMSWRVWKLMRGWHMVVRGRGR